MDALPLFESAGLDPAAMDDPHARYPVDRTRELWRLAVEATGDEALGLRVASHVTQTTFHALGYSLIASRTLQEAFGRVVRYFRVVTDASDLDFRLVDGRYVLSIEPNPELAVQPAPESIDAFASVFVRFCRSVAGRKFAPIKILLRRDTPKDLDAFSSVLRAPLEFGAQSNELHFQRESMELPLETANAELARHNDEILDRVLARQEEPDLTQRARARIAEQLSLGEPSAEALAEHLNLSLRSLQRKLAALGTSYEGLLSDTRRTLALAYMRNPDYSVGEVTYLLGFSDTSSFTRAFRRWTGTTPTAFRAGHDQAPAGA